MRIFLWLNLVIMIGGKIEAASLQPHEIVSAFFGPDGISDKNGYYTGEMGSRVDQPTIGQNLPAGVQVSCRLVSQMEDRCVFAVALTKEGATENWYAYLRRGGDKWRLEAVRTLALTGIPHATLQQLQSKAQRSAEEEWALQNLLLLFKSDDALKQYLQANREQLEQIVVLAREGRSEQALSAARKLFLSSVTKNASGCIELTIGGMLDNSVGFMFVPEGVLPPPIDPRNYIYVERAEGHWYLFKTT